MKKYLIALAAILATIGLSVTPAAATEDSGQVPMPSSMHGWRPQIPKTCVANGDNSIPIGEMAQSWNNVSVDSTGQSLLLTFASNCVTLGYSAGQRFTIDTYSDSAGTCIRGSNSGWVQNGTWRNWSANLLYEINTYPGKQCVDTLAHRRKYVGMAIGNWLGFKYQSSSGWAGRVMCTCNTLQYPTAGEGAELAKLIRNGYIGPF